MEVPQIQFIDSVEDTVPCVATETGTMAFLDGRGASDSFHQQCGGHSCLAEADHASHLQRTTREHFDPNVSISRGSEGIPWYTSVSCAQMSSEHRNPKRQGPNCHSRPRGTLKPAWVLHQGKGPQRPQVCEGEGTQEPWRRGATGCCRLSRQLLARRATGLA